MRQSNARYGGPAPLHTFPVSVRTTAGWHMPALSRLFVGVAVGVVGGGVGLVRQGNGNRVFAMGFIA